MSEEKKKIFLGIEGVPIEHHDLLKKEAKNNGGMSVSALMRMVIKDWYDKNKEGE